MRQRDLAAVLLLLASAAAWLELRQTPLLWTFQTDLTMKDLHLVPADPPGLDERVPGGLAVAWRQGGAFCPLLVLCGALLYATFLAGGVALRRSRREEEPRGARRAEAARLRRERWVAGPRRAGLLALAIGLLGGSLAIAGDRAVCHALESFRTAADRASTPWGAGHVDRSRPGHGFGTFIVHYPTSIWCPVAWRSDGSEAELPV